MGIEPTQSAWKAEILPLNYTRTIIFNYLILYRPSYYIRNGKACQPFFAIFLSFDPNFRRDRSSLKKERGQYSMGRSTWRLRKSFADGRSDGTRTDMVNIDLT